MVLRKRSEEARNHGVLTLYKNITGVEAAPTEPADSSEYKTCLGFNAITLHFTLVTAGASANYAIQLYLYDSVKEEYTPGDVESIRTANQIYTYHSEGADFFYVRTITFIDITTLGCSYLLRNIS